MVFRGPSGAALQLGAQHSQACETWYLHAPGIKVVTPSTPADAKGLLKAAIRDNDPVAFMEGELLYNVRGEVPDDADFIIPLGVADTLCAHRSAVCRNIRHPYVHREATETLESVRCSP